MAQPTYPEFAQADSLLDEDEDEANLAAIDEGIRPANEGRVVPEEDIQRLISQWISKFSTQNRVNEEQRTIEVLRLNHVSQKQLRFPAG